MYGIPDKYIKVISAMCENILAAVKVGNEVGSWFRTKSGVKQGCVLSLFVWIILMDFVEAQERQWEITESNWGGKLSWT